MSAERSPATGRRYPLTQVCRVYRVPRSTGYDTAARTASPQGPPSAKRGPKTPASDETLVAAIRAVLAATPFHGEGHRKVRVRLRQHGHRVSRTRVLRLMRLHGLLAPQRAGHRHGDPAHAGTITPAAPNVLWGTDATRFYTAQEGWCCCFPGRQTRQGSRTPNSPTRVENGLPGASWAVFDGLEGIFQP